jgi:hypothetical protein
VARDQWHKELPSGENVHYTSDIMPGFKGVITAKKGSKFQTIVVDKPMSREEVEAVFSDI